MTATARHADVCRIVVVGTGGLASEICHSLATIPGPAVAVTVITRSAERGAGLCFAATARAAIGATPASFRAVAADVLSAAAWPPLLDELGPDVVLNCVSLHAPREEAGAPSAWSAFVRRAGFAVTLPLQALPAVLVGRALPGGALFLNACYPDLINPLLRGLGVPVVSGVGNAALVATAIQSALGLPDQRQLRVLAHHRHLYPTHDPADDARAWHGDRELSNVGELLGPLRAADRGHRNAVGGHAAARLVQDLLSEGVASASVPGPGGLPGGYPVRVGRRRVEVDLPAGVDLAQAVAWNRRQSILDGADVTPEGEVRFSPAAGEALRGVLPELAAGFPAHEAAAACERMLGLRRRLREQPPPSGA